MNLNNEWKDELRTKYNNHPDVVNRLDKLTHLLKLFISKLLQRHGIECISLLYPKNRKTISWFEGLGKDIFEEINTEEVFLKSIIQIEIPSFFSSNNEIRRHYVISLLNSSFFWHLIQVDDEFTDSMKSITSGQKLFLDANILYSLVGLAGQNSLKAINNLINYAKQLDYKILVTTKTIDEFQYSVNRKFKVLQSKPPIPRELAHIASEQLDDDSVLAVYWKEYAANYRSIEDFISDKLHISSILKEYNISIYDKYRDEIEGSEELRDEESLLRKACGDHFNHNIVEHDAFHRILINRLRKRPKVQFHKAVAWFLTQDSKLIHYSRVARQGKDSLPFCITSNLWIQIHRSFLSRTDGKREFEESFFLLVTKPYIRSVTSNFSLDDAYERVMSQLSRYNDMNPEFALNVVADRHFMITVALEKNQHTIDEKISNRFAQVANKIIEEKKSIIESNREKDEKIEKLEMEGARRKNEIDSLRRDFNLQIQQLNSSLEISQKSKESTVEELQNQLDAETRDKNDLSKRINLYKWLFFGLLCFISVAVVWFDKIVKINWLINHKNAIYAQICLQLIFLFSFLLIALQKHWKTFLSIIVSLIIALITISI